MARGLAGMMALLWLEVIDESSRDRQVRCQAAGKISAIAARSTRPMLTHCSAMGTNA
jgi:hypothetical protein